MSDNIAKTSGTVNAFKNERGGAVLTKEPVLCEVKSNIDEARLGRIKVYSASFGGSPEDSNTWKTVSYLSPFYGLTPTSSASNNYGDYVGNPQSYGFWASSPDVGSYVICIFINGQADQGYYIGCVPNDGRIHMVPAMGAVDNVVPNEGEASKYGGASRLPVAEVNSNNKKLNDNPQYFKEAKPVHSDLAAKMFQQGVLRDPVRGSIGSSVQRDATPAVYGLSTPGRPIFEGGYSYENINAAIDTADDAKLAQIGRTAGHTFVMDDGSVEGNDRLIRLRSGEGHQITLSDNGQTVFIIHANGQSWVELGAEGTVDMYATNSVNIRSQGEINFHADKNINIHAAENLNMYAKNIKTESGQGIEVKAGKNYSADVAGQYKVKVGQDMSMRSGKTGGYASGGDMFINGSLIKLNTGSSPAVPAKIQSIPKVLQTDTKYSTKSGWTPAPGALETIVSRAPTHQPWDLAGKGVDVKINNTAPAAAATDAPPQTTQALASAPSAPLNAVSTAQMAAVNTPVPAVGQLSQGQVSAMVAQQAVTVSPVNAVTNGVGVLKMTPAQMEQAGIIKPGSAALVQSNLDIGVPAEVAYNPALFTGKNSVRNLSDFTKSTVPQINTQVNLIETSSKKLTAAGAITPATDSIAAAGVIQAGATAGVPKTLEFIKNSGTSTTAPAIQAPNSVANQMTAGGFASSMANKVTSGLGSVVTGIGNAAKSLITGISSAVKGFFGGGNDAKSVKESAFRTIENSYPTLQAGKPNVLNAAGTGIDALNGGVGATAALVNNTPKPKVSGIETNALLQTGVKIAATVGVGALLSKTKLPPAGKALGVLASIPVINSLSSLISSNASTVKSSITGGSNNSGLLAGLNKVIGSISSGIQGILGSSGKNGAASANISSAASSIGSLAGNDTKLPVVAVNTLDRSALDNQLPNLLGNPKIPNTRYTANPTPIAPSTPQSNTAAAEYDTARAKYDALQEQYWALNATPAPSPTEASAKNLQLNDLQKQIDAARQDIAKASQKFLTS